MSNEKYAIFHVQGGIGKHIAATAVAKAIHRNHRDRKLIVVCAYPDIFMGINFINRVFQIGNTSYFYQNYIQNKDSIIFHHEPYFTTDHIHKKLPLIQNWCKFYGLEYKGEQPILKYNKLQYNAAKNYWLGDNKKPMMVLHTNGGLLSKDAPAYSWTRDMPEDTAQEIVDHYHKKYNIVQITKMNSPKLKNAKHLFATPESSLSLIELFSILLFSEKRVLIDSCMQHAAAALEKQSVVLWNGTSPKVFGYDNHINISTEIPYDFKLPGSYLFDFNFDGLDIEYPFAPDEKLFDVGKIIDAIGVSK
jgi:hypothetical protein